MDNDMYYMASDDAGATWGSCVNITQFPDSSAGSFRVFAHLTGIFDSNDDFHVAWTAIRYSGWGLGGERLARILHWDEASQSIRTAVDGVWEIELCEGGDFQANVDQPQLSECAGKLFLTFVMFAPGSLGLEDDCGERAFPPQDAGHAAANGEIYVTVSDNNGFNWDPPRNLTQSYTPDCDTFPDLVKEDCHSNNWLSTTRYGVDITLDNFFAVPDFTTRIDPGYVVDAGEYLFTQYVDDADPGGAIRGNGGWHDNPLRVFRFGCVDIVEAAVLGSSIPEGQAIDDPTFTLPGTSETFDWELSNIGNTLLTYTLSIDNQTPANNITITGTNPSIDAGVSNTNDLVVTLNAGLENTVQHAHAEVTITGNFVNGQTAGTMFFNIDYTIGDIQQRIEDSIASCLIFDNRGNIGDQSEPGLSMDLQGSTSECDTLVTSYLFDGSPIISYPGSGSDITISGMFNNGFVDSFLFRPLNDPSNDALSDDDWYLGTSNEFTTYDSTLGLTVDYWAPKVSKLSDDWKVVYGRVCVTNRTLSTINDLYVAYAWDWDVNSDHTSPSNVDNTSGFLADNSWNLMYQQGANDTTTTCLENDTRFAAVRYFPPSEIDTLDAFASGSGLAGAVGFQAMYTRDNATFVGADWDYNALDSMLLNISGFDAFTTVDPELIDGTDLHMVLNGGSLNLGVNDTAYLHFAMITGIAANNTTSDLEGIAEEMKTWSPWTAGTCCVDAGDANDDGNVTIGDVTFLIARIFSGGGPPPCCSEGDANGDGSITIGDVTYLIARIFSGGGAPICGPAGMTCGAN
jgi:hypothetical protein